METRIEFVHRSLPDVGTDAIVTFADRHLGDGATGIDRSVRDLAGPGLARERRRLFGCRVGRAKISQGYGLRARHVIHTVGPKWGEGSDDAATIFAECVRSSLQLAVKHGLRSIAIPLRGTEPGLTLDDEARIAATTIDQFVALDPRLERIVVCCADQACIDLCRDHFAATS